MALGPRKRALFSTFGSAGDLFPLIPVVNVLQQEGWEVRIAVRRGTGLFLRSLGYQTIGLGDGSELRVVADPLALSSRFDGWESWRQTVVSYVAPCLEKDLSVISDTFSDWRPNMIVTSGFAAAARIAAYQNSIPNLELSIYPQHLSLAHKPTRFATPYVSRVQQLANLKKTDPSRVAKLAWGSPADVLLTDPALHGLHRPVPSVGFPYWDGVSGQASDELAVKEWLLEGEPPLLVTLGSFLGMAQISFWESVTGALADLNLRALLVGAPSKWVEDAALARGQFLRTGFIPLSKHLANMRAAIHHGGLGTTFALLNSGRPSVVLPQAFDQPFNARLVSAAGVGVDGSITPLHEAIRLALTDSYARRAEDFSRALITTDKAAQATVRRIEALLAGELSI